jgi:hypothetical protein
MTEQKEAPTLSVSVEDLKPYIQKQGKRLNDEIAKAKNKYGPRYNEKNKFEEMFRRFGDPSTPWGAEQFAKEYMLILQKKSDLPASVRYPVRDICEAAMNECYYDKMVALAKAQKEAKEKEDEK